MANLQHNSLAITFFEDELMSSCLVTTLLMLVVVVVEPSVPCVLLESSTITVCDGRLPAVVSLPCYPAPVSSFPFVSSYCGPGQSMGCPVLDWPWSHGRPKHEIYVQPYRYPPIADHFTNPQGLHTVVSKAKRVDRCRQIGSRNKAGRWL